MARNLLMRRRPERKNDHMLLASMLLALLVHNAPSRDSTLIDPTHPPDDVRCASHWKWSDARGCAYSCEVAGTFVLIVCIDNVCSGTTPDGSQGPKYHVDNACSL